MPSHCEGTAPSVTAIPTVSAAVHHSAYLIATDEANGGSAVLAALKEDPTAEVGSVPAASHGKSTVGLSRLPQVVRANGNALAG